MTRYLLVLLVALPVLAFVLHHDIISTILMIGWTSIVIPLCILQMIDLCWNTGNFRSAWVKNAVRFFVGGFGLISLLCGACIVAWCLYNVFFQQLPEYSGPRDTVGLWLSGFGIAPALISFGWYLMHVAVRQR